MCVRTDLRHLFSSQCACAAIEKLHAFSCKLLSRVSCHGCRAIKALDMTREFEKILRQCRKLHVLVLPWVALFVCARAVLSEGFALSRYAVIDVVCFQVLPRGYRSRSDGDRPPRRRSPRHQVVTERAHDRRNVPNSRELRFGPESWAVFFHH